jgi:arsenite methyltransferase
LNAAVLEREFCADFEADVLIVDAKSDLNLYKGSSYLPQSQSSCCGTGCGAQEAANELADLDFNEWVGELLSLF